MASNIPRYLLVKEPLNAGEFSAKKGHFSFIDNTILNAAKTVKSVYMQAEDATTGGMLHSIHPKVKFFALIYMAVIISLVNNLMGQLCISTFIFVLVLMGRIKILRMYKKILVLAFFFGFLVVFPASLNIITPGRVILNLVSFDQAHQFWIYHLPKNIGFTREGLEVVGLIFLRVWNSISFSILIMITTSFPAFIKSFKMVGVPDTFLMVITLAYKYIFI
ncbi:MAG: CbiQ family ECF transporter T component, partial [Bacteroidales bacterium]